jgi:nicotinamidase/pyrazinamidase
MRISETDALLVIDVQNDFCRGGALEVPNGDLVVPIINRLMDRFSHVILTQDWHPADHSSFASNQPGIAPYSTIIMSYGEQIVWSEHCVQGTRGAAFHQDLNTHRAELIIRKGFRTKIDSYSAFFENDHQTATGLAGYLRDRNLKRLICVGLATDFCVRFSAEDARRLGFESIVVEDACRAIDLHGSLTSALSSFAASDVAIVRSIDFDR